MKLINYDFNDVRASIKQLDNSFPPLSTINSTFDTLCVSGTDNSIWSKYNNTIISALEGMALLEEVYGKRDICFVSVLTYNDEDENNKTKELASDIRKFGFPIIRCLGHYNYKNSDGVLVEKDVWFFYVINNEMASYGFFQFVVNLGKKYDQHSVLICPAKDVNLWNTDFIGWHGYYTYFSKVDKNKKYFPRIFEDKEILNNNIVNYWMKKVSKLKEIDKLLSLSETKETPDVLSSFSYSIDAVCLDILNCYYVGRQAWNILESRNSVL